MRIITIKKGRHSSRPFIFKLWRKPKKVQFCASFSESCRYFIKGEDRLDWLKLCGLSFNLINSLRNSVMIGWRYNQQKDKIELCGYFHDDRGRFFTKSLIDVDIKEVVDIEIFVNRKTKQYSIVINSRDNASQARYTQKFTHSAKWARWINTWFGGSVTAPHDVKLYLGIK